MAVRIRSVASEAELSAVYSQLADWFPTPWTEDRRAGRFERLAEQWPTAQPLMIVAEDHSLLGGALGFRGRPDDDDPTQVTLRVIAVDPRHRRQRVGARLLDAFERRAAELGADQIGLGASDAVPFYLALGYQPYLLFVFDDEDTADAACERIKGLVPSAALERRDAHVEVRLSIPLAAEEHAALASAASRPGYQVMQKSLR